MRLSACRYHRVLRIARTLADLDGEDAVRRVNFAEALAYRALTHDLRRPWLAANAGPCRVAVTIL